VGQGRAADRAISLLFKFDCSTWPDATQQTELLQALPVDGVFKYPIVIVSAEQSNGSHQQFTYLLFDRTNYGFILSATSPFGDNTLCTIFPG
jgi:hypothetical protein